MARMVDRPLGACLAGGLVAALASCSLLTSLDGLSGGDAVGAEGGPTSEGGSSSGDANANGEGGTTVHDSGPPPATVYASVVLADGPIAFFRLDETSGPTARSVVGNVTGTYQGKVAFGTESAVGSGSTSVTFDGTSTRLDFGDVFAFGGTASYSLECWFKPSIASDTRFLFDRRTTASPPDGYTVYYGADYFLVARQMQGTEFGYASVSAPPKVGTWTHVVTTFDGTTTTLYLDGVSVGQNMGATAPIGGGPGSFVMGDDSPGQFNKLAGQVDEFAVYDKALTPARVLAHTQAARR